MESPEGIQEYNPSTTLSQESTQKKQLWKQRADELGRITDALGKPIDTGIFDTVVALTLFDIHTTQSCEGHLDHGTAAPWIMVQAPETDELKSLRKKLNQLADIVEDLEQKHRPDNELTPLYQTINRLHQEVRRPQLKEIAKVMDLLREFYQNRQVSYWRILTINGNKLESQGAPLQEIASSEERDQKLLEYQEEMKTFTAFLKNKL